MASPVPYGNPYPGGYPIPKTPMPGAQAAPGSANPFAMPPMPGSDLQFGTGSNKSNSSFSNTNTGGSNTTSQSNTGVTIDPRFNPMMGMLQQMITKRLQQGLPAGYEEQGLRSIDQAHNQVQSALGNKMANAGLMGTNPAALGLGTDEAARASDIGSFERGLPMAARNAQDQAIQQAMGLIGQFGRGTSSSGTQGGTTFGNQSGSQAMDALNSTAGYGLRGMDPTSLALAQLPGMQMPVQQSPLASGITNISTLLPFLQGQGVFGGGGQPAGNGSLMGPFGPNEGQY